MRPHDLLRLAEDAELLVEEPIPAWVSASLRRAPWVVVRRADAPPGLIPVGVRGSTRAERFAAFLPLDAAAARVRPEDLITAPGSRSARRARSVGALRVLNVVEELLVSRGLTWGPVGSVGFELASGVATASPDSDLDIIVRTPKWWPIDRARELADELARLPVRVDAQLETPVGAVALTEYARGAAFLLRTPDGPQLIDPCRCAAVDPRTA